VGAAAVSPRSSSASTRRRRRAAPVDRAVLLTPGAGSDRNAPALVAVADALAAAGIPSARMDFPYRLAGRKAPDRAPVLLRAVREGAAALAAEHHLPLERVVVGGRSMGGRMCSLAVGDADDPMPALGLLLLGYPLHPAGRPDVARTEHFPRLRVPVLFVSGTRDAMAPRDELTAAATVIPGAVSFEWLPTADHGFHALAAWRRETGRTDADLLARCAEVATGWVRGLA
jgi:predicted alpha/beta-hydrolase family hydrolase